MHSLMISSKPSTGKQQAGDSAIIGCTETLVIFHSTPWKVFLSHFNAGKLEVNSNTNFAIKFRYQDIFAPIRVPHWTTTQYTQVCNAMLWVLECHSFTDIEWECEIPRKAIMDFKMPLTLTAFFSPRNDGNFGNSPIIYTSVLNHLTVKLPYTKELHQEITAAFLPHFQTETSWFPVSSPRLTSLC